MCQRVVMQWGGYGGNEYVYDESTRALRGASLQGDTTWGTCNTFGYEAGEAYSCSEGSLCSLCETGDAACVPVCSIEAYQLSNVGTVPHFEDLARYDCGAVQVPVMRTGCGRIARVEGVREHVFDQATQELIAARYTNETTGSCGGVWGEYPASCADEVVCKLCAGYDDSCPE